MKIQTFSIVTGTEVCNARCPFCVSRMTPTNGVLKSAPNINWRNFEIACNFAKMSGVTTVMLTGKGEPTLYPEQVSAYLSYLKEHYSFPFVELQSNGIPAGEKPDVYMGRLQEWYRLGLTTYIISIVHFDPDLNRKVYLPHKDTYIDLPALINLLHGIGLSVRLGCVLLDGFIDSGEKVAKLVDFAKKHKVEQLTIRPVNAPDDSRDDEADAWTRKHFLKPDQLRNIREYFRVHARPLMNLVHGAQVFDLKGQNICLSNCLTIEPDKEEIRQLIFFPDGHLRYDWQYEGAVIL